MNGKALILFMYLVAVFLVLQNWYKKQNGTGMPYPTLIAAPSYLYGVLALTAEFTGGLSIVLAVGLTFGLYYATHKNSGGNTIGIKGFAIASPPTVSPGSSQVISRPPPPVRPGSGGKTGPTRTHRK